MTALLQITAFATSARHLFLLADTMGVFVLSIITLFVVTLSIPVLWWEQRKYQHKTRKVKSREKK
ncbi:hypothetical protein [Larkinella rosea]|uniref:Uncharacterized protein n=1 Tax=Larkinella rosea TaxID=2025312 RepID=A0A3P1C367_9BACT|nr:hypothetical protein [Larkinella rosea]RRB07831.1 hypothetical protein EHT25_08665 [Larkinella rosea]